MPRAASVLIGPAEMALRDFFLAQAVGQVTHCGFQCSLGHAHHVVSGDDFFRAKVESVTTLPPLVINGAAARVTATASRHSRHEQRGKLPAKC